MSRRFRTVSLLAPSAVVPALLASTRACRVAEVIGVDRRAAGSAARYLQIHDRASIVANVAPALVSLPLRGEDASTFAWEIEPLALATGLVVVVSSTPDVYTALSASTDFAITARLTP